jgi:hypothetical protein
MNRSPWTRRRTAPARVAGTLVLTVCALAVSTAGAGAQERPVPRKMMKQITVMEQIIDQVLIDSPNFLVPGRENTRGIFLPEFGVLLTFEASLVKKDDWDWEWKHGFKLEQNEDGEQVIIIPDEDEEGADEDSARGSSRGRGSSTEGRLYERGKEEIEDVLLDYADTMSALDDTHWIAIAAFLKDSDYFLDQRISRLVIKARMGDLRQFAAEKLTEDQMRERLLEEEY